MNSRFRSTGRLVSPALLFWFLLGVVLILSLTPSSPRGHRFFPHSDKIQHGLAYAVLGALRILANRRGGFFRILAAVLLLTLFGGAIEVLQGYTGRTPEWADLLADGLGASVGAAGAAVYRLVRSNP